MAKKFSMTQSEAQRIVDALVQVEREVAAGHWHRCMLCREAEATLNRYPRYKGKNPCSPIPRTKWKGCPIARYTGHSECIGTPVGYYSQNDPRKVEAYSKFAKEVLDAAGYEIIEK